MSIPDTPRPEAIVSPTSQLSGRGVLIVEDNHLAKQTLADHLRIYGGYEVYSAKTVKEARSLAQQYPTVRLICLDMGLPEDEDSPEDKLSGIVLLREFNELLPRAKIYIKTSTPPSGDAIKFMRQFKSVIRNGQGYDPVEVKRFADVIYSDGRMRPTVFIVHGHDSFLLNELTSFIQNELKIRDPVIMKNLSEGGRVVIEKFEECAHDADLIFALLTPDDAVGTDRRARENVIFEIGYFTAAMGRKSGKLILLHHRDVTLPSDMRGLLTIDISDGILAAATRIREELQGWWGIDDQGG
jgi:CheY-like chemotaxis protein